MTPTTLDKIAWNSRKWYRQPRISTSAVLIHIIHQNKKDKKSHNDVIILCCDRASLKIKRKVERLRNSNIKSQKNTFIHVTVYSHSSTLIKLKH